MENILKAITDKHPLASSERAKKKILPSEFENPEYLLLRLRQYGTRAAQVDLIGLGSHGIRVIL